MSAPLNETQILERLNQTPSTRGFFIAAVDIFDQMIDLLMQRIFRKDNFAVQSVVDPLLHDSGPLGDTIVRLKLLYGLGVISDTNYHDITTFIQIRNQLNRDGADHSFSDPTLFASIRLLHLSHPLKTPSFNQLQKYQDVDTEWSQWQERRQQQIIRSTLSLGIVEICCDLDRESPF